MWRDKAIGRYSTMGTPCNAFAQPRGSLDARGSGKSESKPPSTRREGMPRKCVHQQMMNALDWEHWKCNTLVLHPRPSPVSSGKVGAFLEFSTRMKSALQQLSPAAADRSVLPWSIYCSGTSSKWLGVIEAAAAADAIKSAAKKFGEDPDRLIAVRIA
jgi:hypothetical protein